MEPIEFPNAEELNAFRESVYPARFEELLEW